MASLSSLWFLIPVYKPLNFGTIILSLFKRFGLRNRPPRKAGSAEVKRTEFKVWSPLLTSWSAVFDKMINSEGLYGAT